LAERQFPGSQLTRVPSLLTFPLNGLGILVVGLEPTIQEASQEGKVLRVLLSGRWLPRNQG